MSGTVQGHAGRSRLRHIGSSLSPTESLPAHLGGRQPAFYLPAPFSFRSRKSPHSSGGVGRSVANLPAPLLSLELGLDTSGTLVLVLRGMDAWIEYGSIFLWMVATFFWSFGSARGRAFCAWLRSRVRNGWVRALASFAISLAVSTEVHNISVSPHPPWVWLIFHAGYVPSFITLVAWLDDDDEGPPRKRRETKIKLKVPRRLAWGVPAQRPST